MSYLRRWRSRLGAEIIHVKLPRRSKSLADIVVAFPRILTKYISRSQNEQIVWLRVLWKCQSPDMGLEPVTLRL